MQLRLISWLVLLHLSPVLTISIKGLKKLSSACILSLSLLHSSPSFATDDISTSIISTPSVPSDLSTNDIQNIQIAFRDFDSKRLDDADKEFSVGINKWKELNRPRDEIVSLIKARANVRLDNKKFTQSLADFNEAILLMSTDGEDSSGKGRYPEYIDAFVGRGQVHEGLADWDNALQDYNKAISLWGGGRGEGINPYVLTFRGNVLCRLSRYAEAVPDYTAASDRFIGLRDIPRYSDSRANLALALYELGKTDDALKVFY